MPAQADLERLRAVKTLPSLIAYLRDALDWPIDQDAATDDFTFEYNPEELGFAAATAVHIKEIKQLRPLDSRQPWGVFWVNFEKKRLPVVMLRRILGHLVLKKRASARQAGQRAWHLHDLLFISAYGEESERAITFAHFSQPPDSPGDLPILKVLGWDDGDTVLHLADAHRTLADKLRWPPKTTSLDEWHNQWASAFTLRHREVITTTTELVEELARLADATRKRARTILARESERGPLRRLYAAFKAALIHDLTEDDFADVIAQTISYGLLIARFSRAAISAQNLVDMVPATNPFLRELLGTFLALAGRQSAFDFDELGIQDVVEVLNRSNADAVKADFGNRTRDEDPVIHFYEHFLAAYDRQKKIQRGVFYTPQPAVSYIVRSVHELLQKEFGIEDGLASTITWGDMLKKHPDLKLPKIRVPKAGKAEGEEVELSLDEFFVLILDIATGTGTFLVETIEIIFQHLQDKWGKHGLKGMPIIRHTALRLPQFKDYWNAYVPAALLPRLYGYELMMAPYTIAHMKLALKFSEINARLGQSDTLFNFEGRAHIYLTNTLEPPSGFQTQQFAEFFPALAHEAAAVNTVKRTKRFTVAMGNPPYTVMSANLSEQSRALIDPYRFVDSERLKEKSMLRLEMHLQDDYIKFMRFGQALVDQVGFGLFGYISNHSFLDNPTLRGMRQSLGKSFKKLWLYDLHGNSKKKDDAPQGVDDKNVFDIQQRVAITIGSRALSSQTTAQVVHSDLFGPREEKYHQLSTTTVASTVWTNLQPTSPFYLFVPQDTTLRAEFDAAASLLDIMPLNSCGVVSGREGLTYDLDRSVLEERIGVFCDPKNSDEWIRDKFDIRDAGGYELAKRRRMIVGKKANSFTRRIDVRPFDCRWVAYTRGVLTSDQSNVMSHMLGKPNMGLITTRQTKEAWGVFVTRQPIAHKAVSAYDVSSLFPLHLLPDDQDLHHANAEHPNFSVSFLKAAAAALGVQQQSAYGLPNGLTPEDIFNYAYGVFHSPGFRSRYAEFLKIDFPRLPLTGNLELFRALARLGGELVALHLLEFEVGTSRCDVPARAPAGGTNVSRAKDATHCAAERGADGAARHPYQQLTEFIGGRNPMVEKVSWTRDTVWVDKAQTAGFKGVREDVWNFHIGGYQVCEKWLKDRKGRTLTADDRTHYQKIIIALSETIRLMGEIDEVIEQHGGWPGAFQASNPAESKV